MSRGSVAIADIVLALERDPQPAVAELLGGLPASAAGPADVDVRTVDGIVVPARPPDVAWPGTDLWHTDGLHGQARACTGRASAGSIELSDSGDDARRLLPQLLGHALASHDLLVVHAAAFLAGAGAWLVIGPSGRGKSTVAAGAAAAGLPVLGDDLVVVRRAAGRLSATGLPRPAMVPTPGALGADGRGRIARRLADTPGEHAVVGVVLLDHGPGATSVRTPAQADAFEQLLTAFVCFHDPRHLRRWFPLAGTASRLERRTLVLGIDPAERAAGVSELLGRWPAD